MHSLTAFILATILALTILPAPQSQQPSPPKEKIECGTLIPPEQIKAELNRQRIAAQAATPPTDAPYYLPLTIHLVHRSDGTDGFTLDQLKVAMRDLNLMWQPIGVQFFIYGEIDHINDDTHFNIPDDQASRDALRRVNVAANTINVYFTHVQGLCGQSSFTKSAVQGVLIDID